MKAERKDRSAECGVRLFFLSYLRSLICAPCSRDNVRLGGIKGKCTAWVTPLRLPCLGRHAQTPTPAHMHTTRAIQHGWPTVHGHSTAHGWRQPTCCGRPMVTYRAAHRACRTTHMYAWGRRTRLHITRSWLVSCVMVFMHRSQRMYRCLE